MTIPLQCPHNLYQIMRNCWQLKVIQHITATPTDSLPAAGLAAELGAAGGHAAGALPRHAARRLPGPRAALHPHPALQRREQRLQRQHRRGGRRLQHHHLGRVRYVLARFPIISSFSWVRYCNVTLQASLPWRGLSFWTPATGPSTAPGARRWARSAWWRRRRGSTAGTASRVDTAARPRPASALRTWGPPPPTGHQTLATTNIMELSEVEMWMFEWNLLTLKVNPEPCNLYRKSTTVIN